MTRLTGMTCANCHSPMWEVQRDTHKRSTQSWYECPVCARTAVLFAPRRVRERITTEPMEYTDAGHAPW